MVSIQAQAPQPIRPVGPDGEAQGADRTLRIALPSLSVALAIVAYREFLSFDPIGGLEAEIENFFFLPSYTSPRAILALGLWLLYRRRERLWSLPRPVSPPRLSDRHGVTRRRGSGGQVDRRSSRADEFRRHAEHPRP